MTSLRYADWLKARREEAAAAGRPLQAMDVAAAIPTTAPARLCYAQRRGARVVLTSLTTHGRSLLLDGPAFLQVLQGQDSTYGAGAVVIPDLKVAGSVTAGLRKHSEAMRVLEVLQSLPVSSHLVILTEALQRKYFAPAGMDVDSIVEWRKAFGLGGLSGIEADRRLYRAVLNGEGGIRGAGSNLQVETPSASGAMATALRAERYIIESAEYSGLASDCTRFKQAELVGSAWSFVMETDLRRRAASLLDGTVFTGRVEGRFGQDVHLVLAPPFKAKSGKTYIPLPQDASGSSATKNRGVLDNIHTGDNGDFLATLSLPRKSVFPYEVGDVVELTQAPFLGRVMPQRKTRWNATVGDPAIEHRPYRDVPLSVSLAGAPREAEAAA